MVTMMLVLAHTHIHTHTHTHMQYRVCVEQQIHLIGLAEKQKNELADVNGKAQGTVNM